MNETLKTQATHWMGRSRWIVFGAGLVVGACLCAGLFLLMGRVWDVRITNGQAFRINRLTGGLEFSANGTWHTLGEGPRIEYKYVNVPAPIDWDSPEVQTKFQDWRLDKELAELEADELMSWPLWKEKYEKQYLYLKNESVRRQAEYEKQQRGGRRL